MFDVGGSLMRALDGAQDALSRAALLTSRTGTPLATTRTDAAMAGVARSALFSQALMSAMHARLAEIKSVTRG